jgi:hypothetical protein
MILERVDATADFAARPSRRICGAASDPCGSALGDQGRLSHRLLPTELATEAARRPILLRWWLQQHSDSVAYKRTHAHPPPIGLLAPRRQLLVVEANTQRRRELFCSHNEADCSHKNSCHDPRRRIPDTDASEDARGFGLLARGFGGCVAGIAAEGSA